MRIKRLLYVMVIAVILFILGPFVKWGIFDNQVEKVGHDNIQMRATVTKDTAKLPNLLFKGDLYSWMGKNIKQIQQELGNPIRKDITPYGYTWWIFEEKNDNYLQIGEQNGKVVTVFALGDNVPIQPLKIGQSYQAIKKFLTLKQELSFNKGLETYHFKLSQDDLQTRPLVKLNNSTFMQLYFDHFTNELSSIRLLSNDVLLRHRPYELFYRGNLPKEEPLTTEQWELVERGMEKQVLSITNKLREHFKVKTVAWDNEVAEVAFNHSIDMANKNYFSHFSPDGNGLKERLLAGSIYYLSAGENIAAQYPDAPAVVEGWLNSEGHRKALLNNNYNYLGVGVYHYYYTQNFLEKPSHTFN